MQPYFFPYVGYFQLLAAVDLFIILDDVTYIKKGWINRNNILMSGHPHRFTIPLDRASQNKLICNTKLKFSDGERKKLIKTIYSAYKKAPYFNSVFPIIEKAVNDPEDELTLFIENSFKAVLKYLKVNTKIIKSSSFSQQDDLKAQGKIIDLCIKSGTDTYINPIGGRHLYDYRFFSERGVTLKFLKRQSELVKYKQFDNCFVPDLSFIDVLMFNSPDEINSRLKQYTLE